MPLGKYDCDYCNKQFQDTPPARRRHLQGLQHQRAKALWYSSQTSLNRIHEPESFGKGVCNRFVRTGSCQYGDSCKYYHPKKDVLHGNTQEIAGINSVANIQAHGVPGSLLQGEAFLPGAIGSQPGNSLGNLPPSLWPPPDGGYPPLPFVDWG